MARPTPAAPADATSSVGLTDLARQARILSKDPMITDAQALRLAKGFVSAMKANVAAGRRPTIQGFASAHQATAAARDGRNPRTGEPIKISARRTVKLHATDAWRKELQDAGYRRAQAKLLTDADKQLERERAKRAAMLEQRRAATAAKPAPATTAARGGKRSGEGAQTTATASTRRPVQGGGKATQAPMQRRAATAAKGGKQPAAPAKGRARATRG